MKIMVTVKQVPDTSGVVAVNEDGTLDRNSMATIINPDDLNAVEQALQLKEKYGCKVIAFSMGPMRAEEMLRELLAMGVDEAVLISGKEFGGSDTFATSQIIAAGIDTYGIEKDDLIISGRQAIDGDTAQVGPQIAEKLDLPQITYAGNVELEDGKVTVRRMLEDGYMVVEAETPCLITCIKELNEPRLMNVQDIYNAYEKPVHVYDYEKLKDHPLIDKTVIGLKGSPTNIFKSFTPPVRSAGRMLEGSDKEMAKEIAEVLEKRHIV